MTKPQLSKAQVEQLSAELDGFIQLKIGRKLFYTGILLDPATGHIGLFTNRQSNHDVHAMLSLALQALSDNPKGLKPIP